MSRIWTEAYILSRIRSTLRRLSMQVPAIRLCKLASRRSYVGPNRQQKFEYKCAHCGEWFPEKETQVDHIVPAGALKTFDDVGAFARRLLFPAPDDLQVLCKPHHKEKSNAERKRMREAKKLPVV